MSSITFIVVSLIYIYFVIWYDRVIRRMTWQTYFKIEQSKIVKKNEIEDCSGFDVSPMVEKSAGVISEPELSFGEEKSMEKDHGQQKSSNANNSFRQLT